MGRIADTTGPIARKIKKRVMIVKMHDKMMEIVPVDQLEEILSRSEGHSMSITGQ